MSGGCIEATHYAFAVGMAFGAYSVILISALAFAVVNNLIVAFRWWRR